MGYAIVATMRPMKRVEAPRGAPMIDFGALSHPKAERFSQGKRLNFPIGCGTKGPTVNAIADEPRD